MKRRRRNSAIIPRKFYTRKFREQAAIVRFYCIVPFKIFVWLIKGCPRYFRQDPFWLAFRIIYSRTYQWLKFGGENFIVTSKSGRLVVGDWWCSTEVGGMWWNKIGDRNTGLLWFHNKHAKYVRPWHREDEKIRDGYTELYPEEIIPEYLLFVKCF